MRVLATLVTLAVATAVSPAVAQTDQRATDEVAVTDRPAAEELDRLKGVALVEIDRRIGTLERLSATVGASERLIPNHREALSTQLAADIARLLDLRDAVAAADTLRDLRALVPRIVNDHWVFALAVPKVHEVIAADAIVAVTGDFRDVHDRIAVVLERASAAGLSVETAALALSQARTQVNEARAMAVAVPGGVLPITVDQMPEAGEILVESARNLTAAFELLSESASATRAAVSDLRAAVDQADT